MELKWLVYQNREVQQLLLGKLVDTVSADRPLLRRIEALSSPKSPETSRTGLDNKVFEAKRDPYCLQFLIEKRFVGHSFFRECTLSARCHTSIDGSFYVFAST
nr:hypothetical protein [Tanacetum cinerariifolium]